MHSSVRRTTAGILLLGLTAGTALTGCESIERETGFGKETQTGAAGGAAVGGLAAALASANPAWIAASIVLGGVAGGALGEYLSGPDARKAASNHYKALETLQNGETSNWSNPQTGATGSTTVQESFRMADGTMCKNFTETIRTSQKTVTDEATACKEPGDEWELKT